MPDDAGRKALKGLLAAGLVVAFLGLLGWQFGFMAAITFGLLLFGLSYLTDTGGNVDVSYALVTIALLALVFEYLVPESITGLFPNILAPFGLAGLSAARLAVYIATAILIMWVIDIRFISGTARKPETIVKRIVSKIEKLAESYATAGRALVGGVLAIAFFIVRELGGGVAADLGGMLADVPLVASNVVTGALGFLALGGGEGWGISLTLSPLTFVGVVLVVLGTAWAVEEARA